MIYDFFLILKKILIIKSISNYKNNIYFNILKYFNLFKFEIVKNRFVENLIIYRSNNGKHYIGHIDIVEEGFIKWIKFPYKSNIFKKKLINRGITDMKGSVISFLFTNSETNSILTNDEEMLSIYGIQYVLHIQKKRNKYCFFFLGGEPTSKFLVCDIIKIARRGSFNIKIIFLGKQKHSAYIGKNIINFFLKKIFININKKFINNELFELTKFSSSSYNLNVIPNKLIINFNYRFICIKNIIIIKNKIIKNLIKKQAFFIWQLSGIPFFCYKNFFLKSFFNTIKKIQNILPKINFFGGTSDLRYCYYLNYKSNIIEAGLINRTIHKINENSFFDDCLILFYIYFFFMFGIK